MAGRVVNYSTFLTGTNIRSRQSNTAFQWPATLYVALLSTNPSDNQMTSAVETPYTGYTAATSRNAIASSTSGWNAPSGTTAVTMTNNAALTAFPNATGSGTITGVALCGDNSTAITTQVTFSATGAVTAGTMYWNSITSQSVVSGNAISIASGALTLQET